MSTPQTRNIFQNFSQTSISNKIKQILNDQKLKRQSSPQSPQKSLFQNKLRGNTNPRPLTAHSQQQWQQQAKQYQVQQQQQQQQQLSQQNQVQNNSSPQNIYRHPSPQYNYKNQFQKSNIDSSPYHAGSKNIYLHTHNSFQTSPSLTQSQFKNSQHTWTPTETEFNETKQQFTLQNLSNSNPLFNKKMMVSGFGSNLQDEKIEGSSQKNEIYVLHNSQGNKYRSKLNSQVKTKLNKKNEIIKQFLIKNMKPNESQGFQNWMKKSDSKKYIDSQTNSDQKDMQQLIKYSSVQQQTPALSQVSSSSMLVNPIMLGAQNRQYLLSDGLNFKRPITSYLQRSKNLIPQTQAAKQKQSPQINTVHNQESRISSQQHLIGLNLQNQKIDQASQSFEDENIYQQSIPKQQGIYMTQIQPKQASSPQKSIQSSFSNSKFFDQIASDLVDHYYTVQKNRNKSSTNSSNQCIAQSKVSDQKQYKNQTEQTNFPDGEINSLLSFQEYQIEKQVIENYPQNVVGQQEEQKQSFKLIEKEGRNIKTSSQGTISIQKVQQQQMSISNNSSQASLKLQQQQQKISSTKNLKVQQHILDNSRKKSIRGWSFTSEMDEQH